MLHQITVHKNGRVLISRQYGKTIKKFSYKVNDPSHFVILLHQCKLQFAVGRGYIFFVKGKS